MSTHFFGDHLIANSSGSQTTLPAELTTAQNEVDWQASIITVASKVASDLYDWVDALWTTFLTRFDHALVPAATYGAIHRIQARVVPDSTSPPGEYFVQEEDGCVQFPIRIGNHCLGLLVIGPKRGGDRYSPADFELMRAAVSLLSNVIDTAPLASRIASDMRRVQRFREELTAVTTVQKRLLPA